MTQNAKQVALPIGVRRAAGVPLVAATVDVESRGGESRLQTVGYNLAAAAVIGIIVVIGIVFDVLQTLRNSGRWRDVMTRGCPPELPLHEWYLYASEDDLS